MANNEGRRSAEYAMALTALVLLSLAVGAFSNQFPAVQESAAKITSSSEILSDKLGTATAHPQIRHILGPFWPWPVTCSVCLVGWVFLFSLRIWRRSAIGNESSAIGIANCDKSCDALQNHATYDEHEAKGRAHERSELQVRHIMSSRAVSLSPDTSVHIVKATMEARRIRHVLVCSPDQRLIGVICERDLARGGNLAEQLMTSQPDFVSPDSTAASAITKLIQKQISCLPVVENGRLRGVITATDVMLTLQSVFRMNLAADIEKSLTASIRPASGSRLAYSIRPAELDLLRHAFLAV